MGPTIMASTNSSERPPEVQNVREYPELGRTVRPYVPAKSLNTDYPLIDSDPHFRRVVSYARPSDYTSAPGFSLFYSRSINRFYGFSENRREVEMDMREMTDKVKKGEPLYGVSTMTEYMQGVASRQSRYAGVFMHVMPWFNFVNHNQHGVDTAKYFQNAERELEAERTGKAI